jgi:hypothetical protein
MLRPSLIVLLGISVLLAGGCNMDCQAGKVTVGGVTVHEDDTVPQSFRLDRRYAKKYGITLPVELRFKVPRKNTLVVYPPRTGGSYIKFNFTTQDGKNLRENLQFTSLKIPMGDMGGRKAMLGRLLESQAAKLTAAKKGKFLGASQIKVGSYDAVLVKCRQEDPQVGPIYTALIGILLSDSPHGILAVGNSTGHSDVKSPVDIGKKGVVAEVLKTLKLKVARR